MLAKLNGLFRLTRDAELKYLQNGTALLNMGVACSEKYKEKETQLFLDATVFGKPAEIINQYAGRKGTQIYLSGKIHTEQWTAQDGTKRSKISFVVEGFDFVSNGNSSQRQNEPQQGYEAPQQGYAPQNGNRGATGAYGVQEQTQKKPQIETEDISEDEIPF